MIRREDARLLTGKGQYGSDANRANLLHAVLVRAPHAHARIVGLDTSDAAAMPNVVAVLTHDDLVTDGVGPIPGGVPYARPDGTRLTMPRPVLANGICRFVGEPIAMVLGETLAAARDAAEAVFVEYESHDAVAMSRDALQAGAATVWADAPDNVAFHWEAGDPAVAEAIAGAAHVTRLACRISRVAAMPMEPRLAWAEMQGDGRVALTVSHQSPYMLQRALGDGILPEGSEGVRVLTGDVGGAFGMKDGVHQESVLVAWAARRTRRPVRWVSDRSEAFLSDEQGRDIDAHAVLALDADGHFVALKVRYDLNIGAYLSERSLFPINNMGGLAGVYRTPRVHAEVYGVFTHVVPIAAYRGAGRPEATFVLERIIDVAAQELGLSPFELRHRNLIPPEAMPYQTALTFLYDSGEFEQNMKAVAGVGAMNEFADRRAASAARGRLRGLGLCNCIEASGGPFLKPLKDTASVRLEVDGTLTLRTGAMSTGQGLETSLPRIVAGLFGVLPESIRYLQGDTDQLSYGRGSGGSSALSTGGAAITTATEKLVLHLRDLAADQLEAAAVDLVLESGRFTVVGTDRSIDLAEIASLIGAVEAEADFVPAAVAFPNGTHLAEVEIDAETGEVTLVAYHAVEDIGRVMNQNLAEGQVHGGIAQGVGQALGEQIVHEAGTAQLLTGSFMDYQMPRAADFPVFHLAFRPVPTNANPLGVKGVGEAGTVGSLAAVINAVCDALAPLGIRHIDMPATPDRIWRAMQAARTAKRTS